MYTLNAVTLNVRGLGTYNKRKLIYQYLKDNKVDIAFLQETHITDDKIDLIKGEYSGTWINAEGTSNARGVAILIGYRLKKKCKITKIKRDNEGRMILCQMEVENQKYMLGSFYGRNEDKPEQYNMLIEHLPNYDTENIIIGGDFNCVLDNELDCKNRVPSHEKSVKILKQIIEDTDTVDIWRVRNPESRRFTWFKTKPKRTFSRLDWILINNGLQTCVTNCKIVPCSYSDHSAVLLEIEINDVQRGPGFWKLNNLHLADENFVKTVKQTIEKAKDETHFLDAFTSWEHVKEQAIQKCKSLSKQKAVTRKSHQMNLEKTLDILYEDINVCQNEKYIDDIKEAIDRVEQELLTINQNRVNSAVFRSRSNYVMNGEKNSKFFFNLERKNYFCKNMRSVKNSKNELITEQNKILEEQRKFYQTLFTTNKNIIFDLHPMADEKVLTNEQKNLLERPISLTEIKTSLQSMPGNKCPGIDGLTKEFYETFFETIGDLLLTVYNQAYHLGELHKTARSGLISLLPKPNKNLTDLRSWRPLMMLPVDYKILSKTMSERLKLVLPSIISPEQCGFMKGRQISECIRRTFEVIQYTKKHQIPALIISIDFYKCFDVLEYSAIEGSLNYFGFGPIFTKWVMLFFSNFHAFTQNCGLISKSFQKTRGINQGCNISPFCYLLSGEIMARKLKQNSKIQGIRICKNETKTLISQFADDTALFLEYSATGMNEVIKTFTYIEEHTGLTISYEKTVIYRIGSLADSSAELYTGKPLKWSNDPFQLLGIEICNAEDSNSKRNYEKTINYMTEILENWKHRLLTLTGRCLVVNTLCESLFVYKMSVLLDMDTTQIKRVNAIMHKYIWRNKKARIALETLQNSKNKGGLRLFSPQKKQKALKLIWVKRIKENIFFRKCFFETISLPDIEIIFECNLSAKDCKLYYKKPNFWSQILQHWCELNHHIPTSSDEISSQIIWLNSFIKISNKPIYDKRAAKGGINKISDLWSNGKQLTYAEIVGKFGKIMTWLNYESILKSIPKAWKEAMNKQGIDVPNISWYEKIVNTVKPCKMIYNRLISRETVIIKYLSRWEECEGVGLNHEMYESAFKNLGKMSEAVKLRDFQYRLLLCKIPTNKDLFKWKKEMSDMCTFCKSGEETVKHLFVECRFVKRLWQWVQSIAGMDINVTMENLIYNIICQPRKRPENEICLITKQFIYRKKCLKELPNITQLRNEIMYNINANLYIAKQKNKVKQHHKHWGAVNL